MLICDECQSRALEIIGHLRDDTDVCCGECGHFLGTFGEVRATLIARLSTAADKRRALSLPAERVIEPCLQDL